MAAQLRASSEILHQLAGSPPPGIVFATALAESGEATPTIARLSSATLDGQLGIAGKVLAENPHLYFEITKIHCIKINYIPTQISYSSPYMKHI